MLIQPYVILFILFVFKHIYSVPIGTTTNGPLWGPWRGDKNRSSVFSCASQKTTEIGRFLRITVKRLAVVLVLGRARELSEMSIAWEPDRRSNFFFFGPLHIYICVIN